MIVVLGSINLDIVLRPAHLPAVGETVLAPSYALLPGGKGANQALAARRAGASVAMLGCIGDDDFATKALFSLREAGVDTANIRAADLPTGIALVTVDAQGQNQIVVASGANRRVTASQLQPSHEGWLLLQMEIPPDANWAAAKAARAAGMRVALNLAPAAPIPDDALADLDLLICNEGEAESLARQFGRAPATIDRWLADRFSLDCVVTLGSEGARVALAGGGSLRAPSLPVDAIDTVGAGDAFVGAYVAAAAAGQPAEICLRHGVAAGSLACTVEGAQPSLPHAAAIATAAGKVVVRT